MNWRKTLIVCSSGAGTKARGRVSSPVQPLWAARTTIAPDFAGDGYSAVTLALVITVSHLARSVRMKLWNSLAVLNTGSMPMAAKRSATCGSALTLDKALLSVVMMLSGVLAGTTKPSQGVALKLLSCSLDSH